MNITNIFIYIHQLTSHHVWFPHFLIETLENYRCCDVLSYSTSTCVCWEHHFPDPSMPWSHLRNPLTHYNLICSTYSNSFNCLSMILYRYIPQDSIKFDLLHLVNMFLSFDLSVSPPFLLLLFMPLTLLRSSCQLFCEIHDNLDLFDGVLVIRLK